MTGGAYLIRDLLDGRAYVGASATITQRYDFHLVMLRGLHPNRPRPTRADEEAHARLLYYAEGPDGERRVREALAQEGRALRGEDVFPLEVLETIDDGDPQRLADAEQHWISRLQADGQRYEPAANIRIPETWLAELLVLGDEAAAEIRTLFDALERNAGSGDANVPTADDLQVTHEASVRAIRRVFDFEHEHGIPLVTEPWEELYGPGSAPDIRRIVRGLTLIGERMARLQAQPHPRGELPAIPNAFPDGVGLVSSGLTIRGVVASIYAGMERIGWEGTDGDVPTFDARRQSGARIMMRGDGVMRRTPELTHMLWEQVHGLGDRDVDVLVAMMAQFLAGPVEPDGSVWITASAILDYRGLSPITKREGYAQDRHGHRVEDIEQVGGAVGRLAGLWVELANVELLEQKRGQRKATSRRYSDEDRLVNVEGVERFSEHGDLTRAGRWRIRFGRVVTEFLRDPNRHVAPIMQKALMYDPYRATFEKRLAVYFTFHRRIAASYKTPLRRTVHDLFEQGRLPIDKRNPNRTRDRFETALARLVKDDVLPSWIYTEASRARLATLPKRNWLVNWMACTIEIPPPAPAVPAPEPSRERAL